MQKTRMTITCAIIAVIVLALVAAATQVPSIMTASAQNMTTSSGAASPNQTAMTSSTATNFTVQKTAMSTVDALPGHQGHQAVIVVPQVEVRLLHDYDTTVTPDAAHGKPVTAPFGQGESAISLILASNGAATVPSYYSGSLDFAAKQVAFHTLGGIPFTVTYTVDAVAKSPTS